MNQPTKIVIETKNLTKKYGDISAVLSLNLKVAAGEIFGFLGPNGAGKTTTCRMLTTLTRPTSGHAFVSGFDVIQNPVKAKQGIAVVSQHLNLNGELTAYENLKLHGMLHKMKRKQIKKQITTMLELVDLSIRTFSLVKTFSGGMKRRLMIARALLHDPRVLFMDEPTVGLDPSARRNIWNLVRKINQRGATIFLTTHYIEEAEALCSNVGIIDSGKLIACAPPKELLIKTGNIVVDIFTDNGTKSRFFKNKDEALKYVSSLTKDVVIRNSNLEDVFIKLTGRRVIAK